MPRGVVCDIRPSSGDRIARRGRRGLERFRCIDAKVAYVELWVSQNEIERNRALNKSGIHCIAELYECPHGLLNDEELIKSALRGAVEQGMATLLHDVSHKFHPQGVTALGLIAESHVAIHTWPEYGYAAVDVFTCGDRASAEKACEYLATALCARRHTMTKLNRGMDINREDKSQKVEKSKCQNVKIQPV